MKTTQPKGEMDLPFHVAGGVLQSVAQILVDRGHNHAKVRKLLAKYGPEFEDEFWERFGGPMAEFVADQLGIDEFPE